MSSDEAIQLRRAAMNLLARREHSCAELRIKLARSGAANELIDSVIAALRIEGLQSDARFAEAFVRMHRNRGHGPLRVQRELEQRGIDRDTAASVIDPADDEWAELARSWRVRRFGAQVPSSAAEWQRQARHLQQRGFSGAQVRFALRGRDD